MFKVKYQLLHIPPIPKKYAIIVCPDRSTFASVSFNLQATDKYSATATYFCGLAPCNTDRSPPGWFDDSGTGLNAVTISNMKTQLLYFNVYGWGKYKGVNSFVWSARISDQ